MVFSVASKLPSSSFLKQVLLVICCNLFSLVAGCTLGFSAVLLPKIKNDDNFPYSDTYDSWIASSACLAMGFGSISAGFVSDKYGRRFTQLAMALPLVIGWVIMAFANKVTVLIVGRVLTGISSGLYRSVGVVYLGEISNPTNRPLFIFSLSLSVSGGILFSHILGGYLNWRLSCFIICLPFALGVGLQLFLKESPLWLIYKGKIDIGTEGFIWFRGNDEASQKEIAAVIENQKDRPPGLTFYKGLKIIFSKAFMTPLLTAFLLFTTVQFCGVNSMSFYAQDLMESTFSGEQDPFKLMLITDSARIFGVAILFTFSNYVSRRKCYVIICAILIISLLALIAYIALKPSGLSWLAITVLMFYVALGSILISLSWSFIGEIFPSNLRGLGSGIGSSFTFFLMFVSVNITPGLLINYGILVVYSTFAVVTFFSVLFLYFLLPQSDGKTLLEIENSYNKK